MTSNYKAYFRAEAERDIVYRFLICIFLVFYIALQTRPANYTWVALLVFWVTEPALGSKIKRVLKSKVFIAVISLYAIHALSLIYTADLYEGIKRLETRVALLVFPFLFATISLSNKTFTTILKTFVWGCAAIGAIGLINSFLLYTRTGETVYLYSDNLLLLIQGQAIYFALYLNVAILLCLYLIVKNALTPSEKKITLGFLMPFFVVLIFLLAGRISLAILAVLLFIVATYLIIRNRSFYLGASVIIILILGGIVMGRYFPKTINRFKALTNLEFDYAAPAEVYHFNEDSYENKWNGLTIRLALWSCTWDLIKQQPVFGTGIGDFMDELKKNYTEKNFQLALDRGLSPHNQYLQVWLALGGIGLVVLFVFLIYPAIWAAGQDNKLYLFFLLIVCLNMLTEEVFAVYRGVVFFSFFNALLLFHPRRYPRDTF